MRSSPGHSVQLQGASLDPALLQGAKLDGAELQGASLDHAQLQGAKLDGAELQGASLNRAKLLGASLDFTNLQGAKLRNALLLGASLRVADLQGASLNGALLLGAILYRAQLQGAWFVKVFVWRADTAEAVWKDTRVVKPETGPKYGCPRPFELSTCDWSLELYNELKQFISKLLPESDMRDAMERVEKLDPTKAVEREGDMAEIWEDQARSSPATLIFEKRVADIWVKTGCAAEGAPYVLQGLLGHLEELITLDGTLPKVKIFSPFDAQSPPLHELAKAFLDEEHCPGARGLSDAQKAMLKKIRNRSPAPATKQ